MPRTGLIFATGFLALWLGACGSQQTEEGATPTPAPESSPTGETAQAPSGEPTPPPFDKPLVEQQQNSNIAAEAGLIQSTKPEERLLQLKGGSGPNGAVATGLNQPLEDPFAPPKPELVGASADPDEVTESLGLTARQVPEIPDLPVAGAPRPWTSVAIAPTQPPQFEPTATGGAATGGAAARTTTVAQGRPGSPQAAPGNQSPGGTPARTSAPAKKGPPQLPGLPVAQVPDLPQLPPGAPPTAWIDPNRPPVAAVPAVPPPPRTDIAEAIEVTGVVQPKGEIAKVILKAPTEPTSRYVNVGDRIAGGQVLVKGVKFSAGADPVVIFEQNGVEVAIAVGEVQRPPAELNLLTPSAPTISARNTL